MQLRSFRFEILGAIASLVLATACTAETEQVGTVGVALTATDPTGTTYRLTPGARLVMCGGDFCDQFSLDSDQAFVRIDVPPGDYTAELVDAAGNGPQWPLIRREPGGATGTVMATLVTPMPAPVMITADGLTNLVLRFEVTDIGPITFAEGSVDVSLDVVGVAPANLDLQLTGALDVTSVTIDPASPAALAPRLPAAGDTGVDFSLNMRITGPWTKSSTTTACAPATVTLAASDHAGVNDLLAEAFEPSRSFCIFTDLGPPIGQIFFARAVAPITTTFNDLGEGSYQIVANVNVELPEGTFDGETLNLGPLLGAHTFPASASTHVWSNAAGATPWIRWHGTSYAGQLALSLSAAP